VRIVYFITHPNVVVDPKLPVPRWSLSELGRSRMRELLSRSWIRGVEAIYSSTEQKARESAGILSEHLSVPVKELSALGENDRSSTGYLPAEEFEATATQFFSRPEISVRGWEPAVEAQWRILGAVDGILASERCSGDIAIVSHGGVGTLLLCSLSRWPIDRSRDQPGAGGGNYFAFDESKTIVHGWLPIDAHAAQQGNEADRL
jgi:broad specificity phosphatase PhoE